MQINALQELQAPSSPLVPLFGARADTIDCGTSGAIRVLLWGRICTTEAVRLRADQLAQRVRDGGDQVFSDLRGQYAALVVDLLAGSVTILADRFVTHRLYYAQAEGRLWVSDSLQTLRNRLPEPPSLAMQSIVNYVYFHMIPSPETLYTGVSTLYPAAHIQFQHGQLTQGTHWAPCSQPNSLFEDEQQAAEQLFDTLDRCVVDQLDDQPVGCFLSGGLDSSSIAGLVAKHRPRPNVFSIGFTQPQYDEREYARCAVQHFDLAGHEYEMQPQDVLDALPEIVASMPQPFGNSSVVPTFFCARLAKEQGIDCLIAGDGGDELFAGNQRYAHQLKLDRWRQRIGAGVGLLDLALLRLPLPDTPAPLAKAKSFTRQLKMTIPANLEYFNFLNLIERQSVFSPDVVQRAHLFEPDQRCQQLFDQPRDASALDRMLFMDWKHTLADNDLVKVSSMCQLAGVEVRYPMLDDRLVDLSLAIPAAMKLTPARLRHLYKVAMRDFLPQKIIDKPKHGFGLPFGLWTAEHQGLQQLAYDALGSLKGRGLFQSGFIDDVIKRHRCDHAKHYGELVWVLMVLSLWLEHAERKG